MNVMRFVLLSLIYFVVVSPIWPIGENPTLGDPFVIVNVNTNELAYIQDGKIKDVYKIATGKIGDETPLGTFTVTVKAVDPYFRRKNISGGDPMNPLGTRWIGFDARDTDGRTYGIHGTNQPETIGHAVTAGCIRLPNELVEKLYEMVPLGTTIHIINEDKPFDTIACEFGAITCR
ncbi:L,D-transpeptidase [bacterium LRH843]|nr:L,D-transpeptidase [bacterium LRH843]